MLLCDRTGNIVCPSESVTWVHWLCASSGHMAGDLGLEGTVTERSAEIQEVHLVVVHYSSSEHEHLNNLF